MRVRLQNGHFTEITVRAISMGVAVNMIESQYGTGSFLGCLYESYV